MAEQGERVPRRQRQGQAEHAIPIQVAGAISRRRRQVQRCFQVEPGFPVKHGCDELSLAWGLEPMSVLLEKEREVINLKNEQLNSRNGNLDAANAKLQQQLTQIELEIDLANKKVELVKSGKRSQKSVIKDMEANMQMLKETIDSLNGNTTE